MVTGPGVKIQDTGNGEIQKVEMHFTWIGAMALLLIVFAAIMGYKQGFVREVVTMFMLVLTMVLSGYIHPYVYNFLQEHTPVYSYVFENADAFVSDQLDEIVNEGKETRQNVIASLNLPWFLEKGLLEKDDQDAAHSLTAQGTQYVAESLANLTLRIISLVLCFVIASILVRMGMWALDILTKIPIINGTNKVAGAVLGAVKGIVFLWIILFVMTLFYKAAFAKEAVKMIEQDTFLRLVSRYNLLEELFLKIWQR
ncbi:MAG: CvpA family protein [Blautia sp.]|nr:CvpA family protein [Blautia sp.]